MTRVGKFLLTFVGLIAADVIIRTVFGGTTPIAREMGDYLFLSMLLVWITESTPK